MKKNLQIAYIREQDCVGCNKCVQACPVDAIIGAPRFTHTILSQECIGCGLCLDPCPVDCIEVHSVEQPRFSIEKAKHRHQQRLIRQHQKMLRLAPPLPEAKDIKAEIARARAKKAI